MQTYTQFEQCTLPSCNRVPPGEKPHPVLLGMHIMHLHHICWPGEKKISICISGIFMYDQHLLGICGIDFRIYLCPFTYDKKERSMLPSTDKKNCGGSGQSSINPAFCFQQWPTSCLWEATSRRKTSILLSPPLLPC